jgi:hypothetical protein
MWLLWARTCSLSGIRSWRPMSRARQWLAKIAKCVKVELPRLAQICDDEESWWECSEKFNAWNATGNYMYHQV